mmetsp:Transcript_24080/g.55612  ORF Transcript_24080/g.55612 Transcript_24080/m.55612 type:complete len:1063 (-) Transcript_24080:35-3223(-)
MSYMSPDAVGTTHFSGEPLAYDAVAAMPTGQFNSAANISTGQYSSAVGIGAGQYSSAVGMGAGQYSSAIGMPATGQYNSAVGIPPTGQYSMSGGQYGSAADVGGTAGKYSSAVGMSGQYSSPELLQSNYPDAGRFSSAVGMPPTAGQYSSAADQYSSAAGQYSNDIGMSGCQYSSPLAPSGRFSSAVGRPFGESSIGTAAGRPIEEYRNQPTQPTQPTADFCSGVARASNGQFCSGVAKAVPDYSSPTTVNGRYDSMPGRQFQSMTAPPTAPYRPSPSGFIGAPRQASRVYDSLTPSLGGESCTGRHGGLVGAAPVKSYGSGIQAGAFGGGGGSYVPPPVENNSRTPSRVPSVTTETGAYASEQGAPVWGSERGGATPGGGSVVLDDRNFAKPGTAQPGGRLLEGREAVVEASKASPDTQLSQLPPGARVVEPSRYIRGDSPTPARSMYGTGVGGIDPGRTFGGSTTAPVTSSAYAAKPLYGTTLGLNNRDTSPLYDRKLYGTGLNGTEIWKAPGVARSVSIPMTSPSYSTKPFDGAGINSRDTSSILGATLPLNGRLTASSSYSPQLQPNTIAGTGLNGLEPSLLTPGYNASSLSYQPARAASPIPPRLGAIDRSLSTSRLGAIGGGLATPRLGGRGGTLETSFLSGIGGGLSASRLGGIGGGAGGGLSTSHLGEIGSSLATPRLGGLGLSTGLGGFLDSSRVHALGDGLGTPRMGTYGGLGPTASLLSPRTSPSSSSYTPALSSSLPVLSTPLAVSSSLAAPRGSGTTYEEETYFSRDRILNSHRSQPLQMYPQPVPYDEEVVPAPLAARSTPRSMVAPPIVAPPILATPPRISRVPSQPLVSVNPPMTPNAMAPLTPLPPAPGSSKQLLVQPVSQFTEIFERPAGLQGSYAPPPIAVPCNPCPMGGSLRLPPGRPFGASVSVPPRSLTPGPMPQFGPPRGATPPPPFAFGASPPPPIGMAPPPPIGFGGPGMVPGTATPPGFGGATSPALGCDRAPFPPPMGVGPMPHMTGGWPGPAMGAPPFDNGRMPPFGNGIAMPPFDDGRPVEEDTQYRRVFGAV